jgi:hypothetical protein
MLSEGLVQEAIASAVFSRRRTRTFQAIFRSVTVIDGIPSDCDYPYRTDRYLL